jgi:putative FmdB family regulatory protein
MPIYEFKCATCDAFFEVIVRNSADEKEVGCPECKSTEFERVLSKTNYAMAGSSSGPVPGPSAQTRNCSSGSCTTYTVPGEA